MARKSASKGAFVRIQSTKTINVTMGLHNQDVTNPDAHIPDRLKVNPLWPKLTVLIREGVHWYPSEIAEWPTVKALANDKILTIGEFSDNCDTEDATTEANAEKDKINANIENMNKRLGVVDSKNADQNEGDSESNNDVSLDSLSGE